MTIQELNELRERIKGKGQGAVYNIDTLNMIVLKIDELLDLAEWALCMEWILKMRCENCPHFDNEMCSMQIFDDGEPPCDLEQLFIHKTAWLTAYRQQQK